MQQTTVYEQARMNGAGYREVLPEEVYRARGSVKLVDVRETDERARDGFIAGSQHVPLASIVREAQTWDKDQEIILICRSGGRSARAASALLDLGFRRVMNLAGGMLAVAAAGFPIVRA